MENTKQQYIEEKGNCAKALFLEGYNCAQSVAMAFAKELNLPPKSIAGAVSAFGGGLGRMREVCGAVSGMAFVIGSLKGYEDPRDNEGKSTLYALIQTMAAEFRQNNGSIICRELLSGKIEKVSDTPEPAERTPAYYKKRPCAELVECAARLTAKYLWN